MNERLEGLRDWFAARGLPFKLANETDSTTCSVGASARRRARARRAPRAKRVRPASRALFAMSCGNAVARLP
jgi:hypothetical protein